jgi:hypothetical protein
MVISDKSHEANRRNAQQSTGPKTPEGKKAASLNAVTYGLRTRHLIIRDENVADYWQLWSDLESEWQPDTKSERLYLEQMSVSQWLLARMAASEQRVYEKGLPLRAELDLLDRIDRRRTRLERSFTTAMHELKQLQKERRAQAQQTLAAQRTKPTAQSAPSPGPLPSYQMSEGQEDHPISCAPANTDSR